MEDRLRSFRQRLAGPEATWSALEILPEEAMSGIVRRRFRRNCFASGFLPPFNTPTTDFQPFGGWLWAAAGGHIYEVIFELTLIQARVTRGNPFLPTSGTKLYLIEPAPYCLPRRRLSCLGIFGGHPIFANCGCRCSPGPSRSRSRGTLATLIGCVTCNPHYPLLGLFALGIGLPWGQVTH